MAGFFGLFDYSKPGPGVHKNGPKKKSFVVFEIFFLQILEADFGQFIICAGISSCFDGRVSQCRSFI